MTSVAHPAFDLQTSIPERLVVCGFRSWMAGYETGDIGCWGAAWNDFATNLGPDLAKPAITALSAWVKTVRACSARPIRCFAVDCKVFCQDECAALSLISACQHQDECHARAAAYRLTGLSASVDPTVASAGRFAHALHETGQRLRPVPECPACDLFFLPGERGPVH